MLALITTEYWNDFDGKEETEIIAFTECDSFEAAARYAEQIYGKDIITLKIELLDTYLTLTEEEAARIRGEIF